MNSNSTSNLSLPQISAYNVALKNEQMMLDSLKQRKSIYFGKADKDGNVHVIIPKIIDAKSNKQFNNKVNPYAAQALANMGIKSRHVITLSGAKALQTEIKNPSQKPHFYLTASVPMTDRDRENFQKRIDEIEAQTHSKNFTGTERELEALEREQMSKMQSLETGKKNISYTYYPSFTVENKAALSNVFKEKNTPYINHVNQASSEKSTEKVIDGNEAKTWQEHIKNCMTGNEVILSKDKAHDLASSMIKDMQEGFDTGKPFVLQQSLLQANSELHKEQEMMGKNLELEQPAPNLSERQFDNSNAIEIGN